jgi:vancomycin resistance protein VanJ
MANAAQNKADERGQLLEILGRDKMPMILAGDFNAPALHGLVRELGRSHHNAFARRGQGFGFTFAASLPAIRIDHIFVSRDLEVESVRVEPDWGSDHLALRAVLGVR